MDSVKKSIKNYIPNKTNNLEKYLNESLSNKEFKDYVDKLKLNKKDLLLNLTEVEESFSEFSNCLDCKSIHECKNRVVGHYLFPENNESLTFCYKKCKYQKKLDDTNKEPKNIHIFNASKNLASATMKNIIMDGNRTEIMKWMDNFIQNYEKGKTKKGLYLHGTFGCGKSYLIAALFNEMAKKNVKSAIIFWPEFLRNLKESFDTDYSQLMEYIKNVELLLIDDIGAENVTPWSRDEILCTILQYRMDNSLPVFITSNLNIKELESHYTNTKNESDSIKAIRIMERIKYLSDDIELIGKNLRK